MLGAFVLSYGIFEIPAGAQGDRYGQRHVLARIVLWWSAFTSLTGLAWNFWQLLITRFLFGAGEAGAYPSASGAIARWFPKSERAQAQGFVWAASRFGGALAPVVVVPMVAALGWRPTFWTLGVVGAIWAAVWRSWYHDRCEEQPGITRKELEEIHQSAVWISDGYTAVPWRSILSSRQIWLICAMYWCYAWGSWFYFSWFPTYLVRGVGFSVAEMGVFSSFPFLLGVAGNITGGFASDRLVKKYGLKAGRRAVACTSLAVSSALLMSMAVSRNKSAIVILSSLGFGIMDLMLPAAWAICLDVGRQYAGVVSGIMNSFGQLSGFICTVLFGYIIGATGSYSAPLWIISVMVLFSAALFAFIDPTQPLLAE